MDPTERPSAICASCGAPLFGQYCSQCGEERFTSEKRTLRYFFRHIIGTELLNFDGKLLRTFTPLFARPGFLTAEYALGRRRPYLHPFRILLIGIVAYVLSTFGTGMGGFSFGSGSFRLSYVPTIVAGNSAGATVDRIDRYEIVERMLEAKTGVPRENIPDEVGDRFAATVATLATPLSFAVVVLFGMLLFLLFNRKRPHFVDHLVFALHYYGFALIVSMCTVAWVRLPLGLSLFAIIAGSFALMIWQVVYLVIAVRRFYLPQQGPWTAWPASTGAALLLFVFSGVFITAVQLGSGVVAVWLLP
jgi:hypothetical protein